MFMHRIRLENLLSFGPEAQELELKPLNVLIGPNGSGKSNLIEVMGLLKAAPTEVTAPIREGGGSDNWGWRGEEEWPGESRVEVVVERSYYRSNQQPLRYSLGFTFVFGFTSLEEKIGDVEGVEQGEDGPECYVERESGKVTLNYRDLNGRRSQRELPASRFQGGSIDPVATQGSISISGTYVSGD